VYDVSIKWGLNISTELIHDVSIDLLGDVNIEWVCDVSTESIF
jgi:hypothetical protein